MPEMPEVENIVRGIRKYIVNQKIVDIEIIKGDVIKYPEIKKYKELLIGNSIKAIDRRGKYIILKMDNGILSVIHLRMTGKLLYTLQNQPIDKYSCVVFYLEDGNKLVYADVRRLGTLEVVNIDELSRIKGLYTLGAEPLSKEFTIEYLQNILKGSKSKIKSFLLNQKNIAGLGNIYVDEALFLSEINPLRIATSLNDMEIKRLHEAINKVISAGIEDGGTTFRDYRNGLGGKGSHQEHLYVYNRKGQPCRLCQTVIEKTTVGGRGTYYCPSCQRLDS